MHHSGNFPSIAPVHTYMNFVHDAGGFHSRCNIHRVSPDVILRFVGSYHSSYCWSTVDTCKIEDLEGLDFFMSVTSDNYSLDRLVDIFTYHRLLDSHPPERYANLPVCKSMPALATLSFRVCRSSTIKVLIKY